jgi:hypothetical protein
MDNIEDLISSLSKDATARKPAPHPILLSLKWLAVAVAYLAVSLAISGVRSDLLMQFHKPLFSAEIIVLLGIFISTALSAAVLAFPDLYQKRALAFAPLWIFALFVVVILLAWFADEPPAPLPMHSFECTMSILLFSLLPTIGIFYAMRKLASTHQHASGSIAVLFAFSIGAIWLRLYEPTDSIIHLIEWHYLPMIAVGTLGLWLGKLLLKW